MPKPLKFLFATLAIYLYLLLSYFIYPQTNLKSVKLFISDITSHDICLGYTKIPKYVIFLLKG